MSENKLKIIVIVGPTASGKTSLGVSLAKALDGEVVSADSRQVYRGLDIGTGKVTREEMSGVPHHLLDVADPKTVYTVADYVKAAQIAISDICARRHLPIIVGGTFLYIDTLLGKISTPGVPPNPELRNTLEQLPTTTLHDQLFARDPKRALTIDKHNRRRLVRALEVVQSLGYVPHTEKEEPYEALVLGLNPPSDILKENNYKRLVVRLEAGMLKEVETLLQNGVTHERLDALGLEYRYLSRYLRGLLTKEEMVTTLKTQSWRYAKRQMTWLKRDQSITWLPHPPNLTEAETLIRKFLESKTTANLSKKTDL